MGSDPSDQDSSSLQLSGSNLSGLSGLIKVGDPSKVTFCESEPRSHVI